MIMQQKQIDFGVFTIALTPKSKSTFSSKKVGKKIPENF
jgi:hypothetical protein